MNLLLYTPKSSKAVRPFMNGMRAHDVLTAHGNLHGSVPPRNEAKNVLLLRRIKA